MGYRFLLESAGDSRFDTYLRTETLKVKLLKYFPLRGAEPQHRFWLKVHYVNLGNKCKQEEKLGRVLSRLFPHRHFWSRRVKPSRRWFAFPLTELSRAGDGPVPDDSQLWPTRDEHPSLPEVDAQLTSVLN